MLDCLGFGGDGDEIEAIEDVERDFGVKIDTTTAIGWRMVETCMTLSRAAGIRPGSTDHMAAVLPRHMSGNW